MPDLIRKILTTQVKEVENKDRVLLFVGTTETPDRDNEIIKASAWQYQEYIKNPVVQWAHQYGQPPIGKTLSINQDGEGGTLFEIEFADKETYEFADTIFRLCKGGFLNATSVGFIPIEYDEGQKLGDPRRIYTQVELLEISIVPVPSNPDALITARNAGLITLKEFEFVIKPEETEDYFRIPVAGEGGNKHDGHRIRTIDISEKEGIKALYCGEDKVVITYLFSKEDKYNWTMAKAEAWVKEHDKSIHRPRATSQDELKDELEYTLSLINLVGIADNIKDIAISVSNEIRRLTGGDTPENIKDGTPIRSAIAPIIKALDKHHEAHNKCHEMVMKGLKDMCEDEEHPEMPEEDEDGKAAIREAVRQILEKRRN